jgi:hypothetical protein
MRSLDYAPARRQAGIAKEDDMDFLDPQRIFYLCNLF